MSGAVVAGQQLASPVVVAAGCGGTGRELAAYGALDPASRLGAFTTRTVTSEARTGAPAGCVVESPSGLVHATGLPNPGLDTFLATELPWLVSRGTRVVVSVAVTSVLDASRLGRRLGRTPGVSAIEVWLDPSPPDLLGALEPFEAAGVVAAVRRELPPGLPVWAKIRSDPARVVETARAVSDAGAGAVVVGGGLAALLPDGRPATLAGPAVRPVALACVQATAAALPHVDVVGCGGVATPADLRAVLDAGASAVAVGTALLHDPTTTARLAASTEESHDEQSHAR